MNEQRLSDVKNEVEGIEELILSNQVPYSNDQVAELYSSVKLIRDCAEWLLNNSEVSHGKFNSEYSKKVDAVVELSAKLRRVSRSQVYPSIFDSITEEIGVLHDQIIEGGYQKHKSKELEEQNLLLQKELRKYKDIVKEAERSTHKLNQRSEQLDAIAQSLTATVESKTSQEWTDEYYKYIKYDESFKRSSTKDLPKNHLLRIFLWLINKIKLAYSVIVKDTLFYRGPSYNNLARKWQAIRSLWLLVLFILAMSYLLSLWNYNYNDADIADVLFEKSKYFPLIAVITIGFTFASRNHKINAHLLEQYKHRYVVAKTMNNLMKLDGLKDERVTIDLIQLGSKILFEFKNSGYMNKSNESSVPLRDLADLINKKVVS